LQELRRNGSDDQIEKQELSLEQLLPRLLPATSDLCCMMRGATTKFLDVQVGPNPA
jgi:hypothetical protein